MLPFTPRPPRSGDDRTLTGGLSPDKRALCSSELRPLSSAGGIRTHGLELMRLARTAAPLPRKVWLAGVEPALSGSRSRRGGQSPLQPAERKVGRRVLLTSTGAERCSSASRSHPLPVGTPASHRRGPPGACPAPLATPDARYGHAHVTAHAPLQRQPFFRHSLGRSVDSPIRPSTPGGTRTRTFRVESPASSPFRPRGREAPAAGFEPAPRD